MKTRVCSFVLLCALMSGCETVSDTASSAPKSPANAELADFTIVENFLRAAYCPSLTEFKLVIDPDYTDAAGFKRAGLDYDEELKAGMGFIQNYQGNVYVRLNLGSSSAPATFYALFDRITGKLRVFEKEPHDIASTWLPLSVHVPESPIHTPAGDYAAGETFLGVDGPGHIRERWTYEFRLSKGAVIFRLRSLRWWTIDYIRITLPYDPPIEIKPR